MPKVFVPARNSRHRTACFALYKALIRQSVLVPLADELLSAPGLNGPVHPIKHLVRKGFRRNVTDTSPRLVISALRNGYRFLDMLSAAQSTDSEDYRKIHEFIRARQARKLDALSSRSLRDPPPPKPSSAPNPNTIPLLTRVSGPNEPPRYEPTVRPRPLSELGGTGIRRVPVLDVAANLPYLRQTKPQTRLMNRIIRQKSIALQERVAEAMEMIQHPQDAAKWEDAWDQLMSQKLGPSQGEKDQPGLFKQSSKAAVSFAFDRLKDMRLDSYARGTALHKLVEEERALRDKERTERREQRRKEREARKAVGNVPETSGSDAAVDLGGVSSVQAREDGQLTTAKVAKKLAAEVAESEPFIDQARADTEAATKSTQGSKSDQDMASDIPAAGKMKTKQFQDITRKGLRTPPTRPGDGKDA